MRIITSVVYLAGLLMGLSEDTHIKAHNKMLGWIIEKAREFQKNIYFCFIDYAKAFDCGSQQTCGKFLKRWEYQTTSSAS